MSSVPMFPVEHRLRYDICFCGTVKKSMKCIKCKTNERRNGQRWCKECHAANMRLKRPTYSALTEEQRQRNKCRAYANVYKQRGKLIQEPCEQCGDNNSEMHHEDYSKPLEVKWWCRDCHLQHH